MDKESINYRYERKFIISELSKYEIEAIVKLHPAIFSEIYHERSVNNIYFDTHDMTNYFKNVDGLSQRAKYRVRWYGDLFGEIRKPVLEVKLKDGQLGAKLHYPLDSMVIDSEMSNARIKEIILSADLPDELMWDLKSVNYTLMNRYIRKYYLSQDKKFRITIDSDMRYIQLSHFYNTYLNQIVDYQHNILELKYEKEHDSLAREVTNDFRFRMTKSSKYVTGIDMLHHSLM